MFEQLGWILGKGRWGNRFYHLHGGVDLLLTNNSHEHSLHGRYARIVHNLQSNALILLADKKIRFDGENVNPGECRAFRKKRTSFVISPFKYQLEFMELDGDIYRAQLA